MSNKGIINNALHRPLDGGNYYSKFIPSSTCESTYLGKGDTFFSMDGIKANILKNHAQCARLAPQLQKKTLAQTITSIYDFEYNHIQYKADGADQTLRSPACSWHVRKEGIDCKSYSIFTGCILTSLGIKYYIRKIKQPGMLPNEYTHVYIVVPKDQKKGSLQSGYYVIDATKHENTEAAYIAKNDVFMDKLNHFGLQAPALSPPIGKIIKGNRAPITEEAKQGFRDFLAFLQKVGIDQKIICKIRNTVKWYLDKGVNPQFVVSREGVLIEGTLIKYAYPEVNGHKIYKSPIAIALSQSKELKGLKAGSGNETTTEDQLGEELGTIVEGMFEDSGWWDNTFGAVFGNGWDLTCFGASNNPKKSAKEVAFDASEYFNASGLGDISKGGITTANLQKFVDVASVYIAHRNYGRTNGDIAKCTRKGNEVGYEGMVEALYQVISNAKRLLRENNGDLVDGPNKTLTGYNYTVPSGYHDGRMQQDNRFSVTAKTYKVIAPKPIVINPPTTGTGGGSTTGGGTSTGGNTGGNSNPGGGVTLPPSGGSTTGGGTSTGGNTGGNKPPLQYKPITAPAVKPPIKKAGLNPIIVIGLIAGSIYMAKKNNSKK